MGIRVGEPNFFLGQSIGIDETNTIQLKIFSTRLWNLNLKFQFPIFDSFRDIRDRFFEVSGR